MNSGRSSRLSRDVQPGSSIARSSKSSKSSGSKSHAQRQSILDRLATTGNKPYTIGTVDSTVSPAKPVSTLNLDPTIKETRTLGRSPSRSRLDGSASNFELLGENNSTFIEDGAQLWSRPASRRESETSRITGIVQTSGDYQKASNYSAFII